MSHSSGISVTQSLTEEFGEAVQSQGTRLIKVQIVDEQLVPIKSMPVTSGATYEDDLEKIHTYLDLTVPSYILFRLDEKNATGFAWVIMCYVPDKASVKDKMKYASTRSNLKKQLGGNYFIHEIFGTVPGDFNKKGYKAFIDMQLSESPLTHTERQTAAEKEGGVFVGGSSTAYIHGVAFPVETAATDAIKGLLSGQHTYVQLAIEAEKEKIILAGVKNIAIDELGAQVPRDNPRFHFFRYDHDHEGEQLKSIVSIYSCPDGSEDTISAPVRLRMLYSSSKANIENVLSSLGGKASVKLEVNAGSEVNEEIINNELHPPKEETKKAFSKPKGPTRGGKRLIKEGK
eukprot:TRINITY_DN256_c0_g1_i1.p2 TRINITY_DN256_c0_g1~~TRINITY_DN256_c0_g1_i1.p2  ORF type:complete len:345 (-),score=81.29 TRINITY_DN256_c0_g1_i1:1313-2347(-)